jgi:hypothetical protein
MLPKKKAVIVTVDDNSIEDLNRVADECKAVGLHVQGALEFLGQITGEIDPQDEDKLRRVRGVLSVDESRDFQLPPPDSETQ